MARGTVDKIVGMLGCCAVFGAVYLAVDVIKGFIDNEVDDRMRKRMMAEAKAEEPYRMLEKAYGTSVASQIYCAYKYDRIGKEEYDNEVFKARLFVANGIVYERKNK